MTMEKSIRGRSNVPITTTRLPNPFLDLERRALQLDGKTKSKGFRIISSSKTADYTLTELDELILCDCQAGNITITVPLAASYGGKRWIIKKIDSTRHHVKVQRTAPDEIDGETEWLIITQYDAMWIVSDGDEDYYFI